LGHTLDHGMRRMAARAHWGDRVTFTDQGRVDAFVPLPELLAVTGAADLDHGEGKVALAADRVRRRRMTGQVHVGMAAGAPDRAVDRLRQAIARYVQRERSAVYERLLEPRHPVTAQTLPVSRGQGSGRYRPGHPGKRQHDGGHSRANRAHGEWSASHPAAKAGLRHMRLRRSA